MGYALYRDYAGLVALASLRVMLKKFGIVGILKNKETSLITKQIVERPCLLILRSLL